MGARQLLQPHRRRADRPQLRVHGQPGGLTRAVRQPFGQPVVTFGEHAMVFGPIAASVWPPSKTALSKSASSTMAASRDQPEVAETSGDSGTSTYCRRRGRLRLGFPVDLPQPGAQIGGVGQAGEAVGDLGVRELIEHESAQASAVTLISRAGVASGSGATMPPGCSRHGEHRVQRGEVAEGLAEAGAGLRPGPAELTSPGASSSSRARRGRPRRSRRAASRSGTATGREAGGSPSRAQGAKRLARWSCQRRGDTSRVPTGAIPSSSLTKLISSVSLGRLGNSIRTGVALNE